MLPSQAAEDPLEPGKMEFITLSLGVQYDHPLPEKLKNIPLKFEGSYRSSVKIARLKKQNAIRFFPQRMPPRTRAVTSLIIKHARTGKILKRLNIKVNNVYLERIAKEISDLLITVDGVEVKILNNKVIIDGQVMLYQDRHRIHQVASDYMKAKAPVSSFVTMSPEAPNQIARLIEKKAGNPAVTVTVIHGRYIIEGTVDSPAEKQRICGLARYYTQYDEMGAAVKGGELQKRANIDLVSCEKTLQVPVPPKKDDRKKLVQVTMHFVELKKDYNKGFLFQWTPAIGGDGTQVQLNAGTGALADRMTIGYQISATIQNFLPKLNWAKSFGFARVLHNSSLIMEEGKQGTISSGSTLFVTAGDKGVQPIPSKIQASVKPKVQGPRKDTVHLDLTFQVQSVVGQNKGSPVVNNRSITTALSVRSGLSAALGGLISSNVSRDFNRLPAAETGGRPLVSLFSSKNYDTARNQFVVFVTPIIKSSASLGTRQIKKKFQVDQD